MTASLNNDSPASMDAAIAIIGRHGLVADLVEMLNGERRAVHFEMPEVVGKIDHSSWLHQQHELLQQRHRITLHIP